jgi:glucose-6-phosphate-specific signal transduction histidine kinase
LSEAQSKAAVSQPRHKSPRSDVIALIGISALSLVLSAHFQLTETLFALTRRWEYFQLDELPFGLLVLAIGLIWLSWRRYRQAQLAETRLAAVLADNRRLAQEHLRIQELERKHLARELHDELGQYLNAIKLDAVAIGERSGCDAQFVTHTSLSIIRSVDHVHEAVSDMIGRLRPLGLDELGLAAAIEHCVDQWRRRLPDTHFSLTTRGDLDELNEPLSLTLYRLIQEGLTNVYKHAAATQVRIELERRFSVGTEGNQVHLTVADNGHGMDTGALISGFGLRGMRERVEMAGGTFVLASAPGCGLSFAAHLPAQGK